MKQTWRWFGPNETTTINDICQASVEGVVSALHHVATGAVWTSEEIHTRQQEISTMADGTPSGLAWDVVESLPVSENIKKQQANWKQHIDNYKISMRNLADAGVNVICYNFMPVLDWTRTDLAWVMPHGGTTMRFDLLDFAAFDLYILKRDGVTKDYSEEMQLLAKERLANLSESQRKEITENVACGLPGAAEQMTLEDVRDHLAEYQEMSPEQLRSNLIDFLQEVAPLAEELGMRLCCHPDDPPFPLLGLPRIMSTEADYLAILEAVNIPANGITLCTGSLGARADNDLPGMIDRLGDRIHFLHLRNVRRESIGMPCSFHEAEHLDGDSDMVAIVAAVIREEEKRKSQGRADWSIPIRPDHGMDILGDLDVKGQPGYPSIGRLKGLAELRGLFTALSHKNVKDNFKTGNN